MFSHLKPCDRSSNRVHREEMTRVKGRSGNHKIELKVSGAEFSHFLSLTSSLILSGGMCHVVVKTSTWM